MVILDDSSPTYNRQRRQIVKRYRRAEIDLAEGFADILKDHKRACNADSVPGFEHRVWKHRIASSDINKGRSAGFRVMSIYDEQHNTLRPFCVYTHGDYPGVPPVDDVRSWIKQTLQAL